MTDDLITDREWLLTEAPPAAVMEIAYRLGLRRAVTGGWTPELVLASGQLLGGVDEVLGKVRGSVLTMPHLYVGIMPPPKG